MLRTSFLRSTIVKRCLASTGNGTTVASLQSNQLRNFIIKSTVAVSLFYTGGVALSQYNEKFADLYTAYVPFAENAVDAYEAYRYNQKTSLSNSISVSGFRDKIQTIVYGNSNKYRDTPNIAVIEEFIVPTKLLELDLIQLTAAKVEPKFYKLVDDLNKTIEIIVNQKIPLTESQTSYILDCYNVLSQTVLDYNREMQEAIAENIELKTNAAVTLLTEEYTQRLTDKEVQLTKNFIDDFNDFKEQLEQRTANELSTNLRANEQNLLAKHANEVALLSITQVEEFTKILKEKIDKEREGRLGRLTELDSSVNDLSKSVDSVNDLLFKNEVTTQLILLLTEITMKLHTAGTVNDGININKELNKIKLLCNILPAYNSSCACSKKCKPNCKCYTTSDKKLNTLMNVTISELEDVASKRPLLSNEQLYNRWGLLENDFKTTSLLPQNPGILGHISAKIFSLLLFTKRGVSPDGTDLDSFYSKVSENIRLSKLDVALADAVSLQGWPHVLCQDWIEDAKVKLEVQTLIEVLDSEIRSL